MKKFLTLFASILAIFACCLVSACGDKEPIKVDENTVIITASDSSYSYWMLYTSDSENANQEWGTFEYEDSIYGSATLGADALIVKEDCIYIWAYQTF